MNMRTKIAAIPIPSKDYTRMDFDQAFRKFNQLIESVYNPGDLIGCRLIILAIAESGYGQPVGTFYDTGTGINIVREGEIFAPSFLVRVHLRPVSVI